MTPARDFNCAMTFVRFLSVVAFCVTLSNAWAAENTESNGSFATFLQELWPEAKAQGIRREIFDAAFAGVTPDPRVLAATKRQPEYGKPFGAYVNSMVSKNRIDTGARKLSQWADTLRAVETKFGVDPAIIVSIWGIESSFGDAKDRWDVIRSLATLAQARFQHPYFRGELLSALKILQEGHVGRRELVGSWAGAMGQTQFMPSSFFSYAVDFSGDGRRDIWANVPDVLASIANYMQKSGWQAGMPWGFEVVVPKGFDYKGPSRGSFAEWKARGLSRTRGAAFPEKGDAILFFPSGAPGPAFLVTDNFTVIKRFNNSDAYALAIAHLADRMRGGAPIDATWPRDDFQPSRDERIALQRKLAELGYKVRNFTGHLDFDLRDALREQEKKYGMIPDGYPSRALLDRIGVRTP
jgi:membrane-bound lytic murein transglycosylase B